MFLFHIVSYYWVPQQSHPVTFKTYIQKFYPNPMNKIDLEMFMISAHPSIITITIAIFSLNSIHKRCTQNKILQYLSQITNISQEQLPSFSKNACWCKNRQVEKIYLYQVISPWQQYFLKKFVRYLILDSWQVFQRQEQILTS